MRAPHEHRHENRPEKSWEVRGIPREGTDEKKKKRNQAPSLLTQQWASAQTLKLSRSVHRDLHGVEGEVAVGPHDPGGGLELGVDVQAARAREPVEARARGHRVRAHAVVHQPVANAELRELRLLGEAVQAVARGAPQGRLCGVGSVYVWFVCCTRRRAVGVRGLVLLVRVRVCAKIVSCVRERVARGARECVWMPASRVGGN